MDDAPMVWPAILYRDAHAAIRFLVDAFGFEEAAVVEHDGVVHHAELRWPLGGGVMLGSTANRPGVSAGVGCVYVVTDEPDALHDRAVAAGAEVMRALHDESFGSRTFTVRDPEGNEWAFGTYRGA